MRPADIQTKRTVYECFGCGHRIEGADTRFCTRCGSNMRNIGQPRDL